MIGRSDSLLEVFVNFQYANEDIKMARKLLRRPDISSVEVEFKTSDIFETLKRKVAKCASFRHALRNLPMKQNVWLAIASDSIA